MKKLVLALAIGLVGLPALAQDKPVDLKISIWLPPAHSLVPASKEWAASIEKASNGSIKTAIFPYDNPALFSMAIAFAGIWLFSVTDHSQAGALDRKGFEEQEVRSETGVGTHAAVDH